MEASETFNVPHEVSIGQDYTSVDYETTDLQLVGDAFWTSDEDGLFQPYPRRLRLTNNGGNLNGSAWLKTPIDPSKS